MKTKPLFLLLAMLLLAVVRSQAADGSLSFSGTAGQYVEVPNFDGLGITNEVTVEFWAQPVDQAQRMAFVLHGDNGTNRFQAHIPWENGSLFWDFGDSAGAGRLSVAAPAGSVGSWRHYALVATQGGNAMRIYQNGSLIASKTGMDALEATSAVLRIGGNALPFSGKLDDFRIWNVARTEAEIRASMASPPLGNEAGLTLYLRFDEPSGLTAVNSATATGAAFNGTLNGAVTRVASPFNSIVVQNTNDSSAGSLRQAVADAAAVTTAPSLITFAPGLSSGTITLLSEIIVNTPQFLLVDGSTLPAGITVSGGNAKRLFFHSSGSRACFRALTLTGGNGAGTTDSGRGGAIYNNSATLVLDGCTLHGNTGSATFSDGGAIFNNFGSLTLTNCTLTANTAVSRGGAIFSNGPLTLTHCTVTANSISSGSGTSGGGGIYFENENIVGFTLENSIVAANTAPLQPDGKDILCSLGKLNRAGANLVQDYADFGGTTITGPAFTNAAPNLAALASNGGPTQTMLPNAGSPAIDSATGSTGSTATTDQRGLARPHDGDALAGAVADIGAVEAGSVTLLVTNTNNSGPGSLRQTLTDAASFAGPNTLTFAPDLSGQTLTFGSEIVITDNAAVTVDASSLPAGLTLDGGPGTNRLFSVPTGTSLTLTSLTLTGGNGGGATSSGNGGAILNQGTLTLTHCTLSGNSADSGGAIYHDSGTLTLTHCTLSGNSANDAGAILHGGGTLTLTNSIIAGNTASIRLDVAHFLGTLTPTGVNFIGDLTGTGLTASATLLTTAQNGPIQLAPLASNGGPTQTMALLPGSPAINAAVGSTITADQRGQLQSGGAWDLGAYERQLSTSVTTTADSGEGSLRGALADAAALPGASTLTLPGSFAVPITLSSELVITDTGGVTLDATASPAAVTIDGGPGTNRILDVRPGASVTLRGLRFTGGKGGGAVLNTNGGALNNQGTLTVMRCAFESNSAAAGGAINSQGALEVSQYSFVSNSASFGGAIHSGGSGLLTVADSTFLNNTGTSFGGAVLENDADAPGHPTLTRCTFHGNSAANGGAVFSFSLTQLSHCTISGNTASASGGGVCASHTSVVMLSHCIVSGNTCAGSPDLGQIGSGVLAAPGASLFGSLTGSGLTAGPQTLLGSALLAPPDNYGGPTPTMALLPGSPARNVANHAPNASFEANTFGGSFSYTNSLPGGAITGWTSSPSNRTGLCVNGSPFANGGLITEGTKAAFLQCFSDGVATTLSTTLTGLTVGTNYTVTFRTAGRQGPVPGSTWSINGGAPVAFNGSPVGAGQPFRTIIGTFTATASTAALAFTNQTAPGTDTTVLIDAVTVAPTTPTDQRGFPIVGVPDLGAYEAGTLNNFNAWIYETLPVTATAPQHAATFDFDGDGQSNEKEWTARTDPGSASSYFRVTQSALSGGQFQVTIPTVAGRRYTLESSPDLVNWTDGPGHLALGTSHTFNVFFFEMPAMRFFKVRVGDP